MGRVNSDIQFLKQNRKLKNAMSIKKIIELLKTKYNRDVSLQHLKNILYEKFG